jgi:uncharacterized protein YceK
MLAHNVVVADLVDICSTTGGVAFAHAIAQRDGKQNRSDGKMRIFITAVLMSAWAGTMYDIIRPLARRKIGMGGVLTGRIVPRSVSAMRLNEEAFPCVPPESFMRRAFVTGASLCAALCITGCASIGAHSEGPSSSLYPGVRNDAHYLAHPPEEQNPVLAGIDLPFSFIGDTLFLPWDVIACMIQPRNEPNRKNQLDD